MSNYIGRKGPLVCTKLGRWAYNMAGFNQYGLHHDDCLDEEFNPDVKIAVSRLPRKLYDERVYRCIRAMDLSMHHTVLPREQWTKYEEDYRYLEPYLNEVIMEREEREYFENNY